MVRLVSGTGTKKNNKATRARKPNPHPNLANPHPHPHPHPNLANPHPQGSVSAAFFLGYTLTNPVAGYLLSRNLLSPTKLLAYGVTLWSTFTVLTPLGD